MENRWEGGNIKTMKTSWDSVTVMQVRDDGGGTMVVLARMERNAW